MDVFTHFLVDKHLVYLQFLAIKNKTAVNICLQVCVSIDFHFLMCLEEERLNVW